MFRIFHRRRREKKTDYGKRLNLLRSDKTRIVIRKSLTGMKVQFIDYEPAGDKTRASAVVADITKFGWKGHTGNIPSAYLVGLAAGLRAKAAGINEAILDAGLQTSTKGSRIYAALKGVIDAGIEIPYSKEILPDEARISGDHIVKFAATLDADKKSKLFSKIIKNGLNPEDISKHFSDVKKNIMDAKGVKQ